MPDKMYGSSDGFTFMGVSISQRLALTRGVAAGARQARGGRTGAASRRRALAERGVLRRTRPGPPGGAGATLWVEQLPA